MTVATPADSTLSEQAELPAKQFPLWDSLTQTPTRVSPFGQLDMWRGIASLAVVAFHWGGLATQQWPSLHAHPLYRFAALLYLGVPLFFVVSGFCIAGAAMSVLRRNEGTPHYLWARVRRIYPPYWAAFVVVLISLWVAQLLVAQGLMQHNVFTERALSQYSFAYYAHNFCLTMVAANQPSMVGVAWTLAYELGFYLLVGLALLITKRVGKAGLLLTLLHTLTFGTLIALIATNARVPYPFDMWPQFGLGVLVYDLLARPQLRWVWYTFAGTLVLTLAFALFYSGGIGVMQMPGRITFIVCAGFALMLLFTHRFDERIAHSRFAKPLAFVGLFSYSLYLIHFTAVRVINQAVRKLQWQIGMHGVAFVLALGFALVVAYMFFLLFERPLLRVKPVTKAEPNRDENNTAGEVPPAASSALSRTITEPVP